MFVVLELMEERPRQPASWVLQSVLILVGIAFSVCNVQAHDFRRSKRLVLIHGILNGPEEFKYLLDFIKQDFPLMNATALDGYNYEDSVFPLWEQVDYFSNMLQSIMNQTSESIILLCFSQGGVICRGVLSVLPHNVETFIALSSPLAGQYGDTEYLKYFFPEKLKRNLYKLFYTTEGQKWSFGNYWNDPHHHDQYMNYSDYLAVLNNETINPKSADYKDNFLRLKRLVLIGGPDDGVITPWQSSQFGFFDHNEEVWNMMHQTWYKDDSFGLRTLNERGSLHFCTVPSVKHTHWHRNLTVYHKCIKPWLH